MVLATADVAGQPAARVVLLKGHDERGLVFFTNYESRKARELAFNPRAALVFWWDRLGRQVRVEGPVERVGAAESDAYFAQRPREAQLGAHASPQSRPLVDRHELEERWADVASRHRDGAVPRPVHWGGFRLRPERYEFWSQAPNRLHDRFAYTLDEGGGWRIERLAP